ncbi:MAG: TonB-dependent receptor [Rhodospirillaceae bacterium]|nr:TonB-dependent receptor [Rhodospirillaceae bacterium]
MNRFSRVQMTATAALMAFGPTGVNAQQQAQAQSIALEEIVVTARRVEENLMTVPLAITAFTSRDIESANIKQLSDVVLMTPSFNYTPQAGNSGRNERGSSSLVFRGLFLTNQAVGLIGGGSLFIDGTPVVGAQPPSIADVERIEVLKGPQSVYFGRSTFLGAINYVTKDPSNEFRGKVNAEISSFGSHDASLTFEGPLVMDRVAARVTGRHFRKGGAFVNAANTGGQKFQEQNTGSISSSVVFTPSDNFKAKAYVNWFEDNDGPPAQGALKSTEFTSRVNPDGSCTPFSATNPRGSAAPGITANSRASFGYWCGKLPKVTGALNNLISGDYDFSLPATRNALFNPNPNFLIFDPSFKTSGGLKRHAFQANLRLDYETAAGYAISSLSAYHRDKAQVVLDLNYRDSHSIPNPLYTPALAATHVPWIQFMQITQNKTRDFSEELRLTSPQDQALRFTVGGNYFDGSTPGGTVYGNSANGPNFSAAITAQDVKTPALFAGAYYDFTPELTLTLEGRYQWDKISQVPKIGTNGAPVPQATVDLAKTLLKETYTSFSPRVSLDYKYADNSTIYALFSRGYRPGGFNAALITSTPATLAALTAVVPNAGISYLQERLDNFELGVKSSFLDGRARTTVTAYYDEWLNGQVANSIPVSLPPAVPGGPPLTNLIPLTVNNGKAVLKGVELEGQFQATEGLRLSGTFAINDSEIKTFGLGLGNCADCLSVYNSQVGTIGRRLPITPKYTWSAAAEYEGDLNDRFKWFSRVDYAYRGKRFTDFSAAAWIGGYNNVNARVGIRDEDMSLEAFVTNLTKNRVMKSTASGVGVDLFTFPAGLGPFKNEIRFAPADPRAVGVRASYNF